jgi:hypothetical protein
MIMFCFAKSSRQGMTVTGLQQNELCIQKAHRAIAQEANRAIALLIMLEEQRALHIPHRERLSDFNEAPRR